MGDVYAVTREQLVGIADSIRAKNGETIEYGIEEFKPKIDIIESKANPTKNYIQDGLVGFFELNNDCYDYMDNFPIVENNMTFREDGKIHRFTRHNGYCGFNASKMANSKQFTISLWIKSDKFNGTFFFSIGKQAHSYHAIGLRIGDVTTGKLAFNFSGETYQNINNPTDILDNNWHQVTITYNNNLLNCYVDNIDCKLNKTIDIIIGEPNYAKGTIGAYLSGGERISVGTKIANFIIYNRSLTQAEIEQNYNADKDDFINNKPPLRDKPAIKCEYIYSQRQAHDVYLDIPALSNIQIDIEMQADYVSNTIMFGTQSPVYYLGTYKNHWIYGLNNGYFTDTKDEVPLESHQLVNFNIVQDGKHKILQTLKGETIIHELYAISTMSNAYNNISLYSSKGSYRSKVKIFDVKVIDNTKPIGSPESIIKHFIPCLDDKKIPCFYEEKEHIYYYDDNPINCAKFDYKELI